MTFCSNTLSLFAEKSSFFFHILYRLLSGIPLTEAGGTQSQWSERAQSLKQKTRFKRESWSLWFPPSLIVSSFVFSIVQPTDNNNSMRGGKKPQKYTQDIAPSHQSVFVVNDMKPTLCFVPSAVCTNITLRCRWKKDAHVNASLQARPDHPIAILGTKSRVDDAWVTIQVAHKCFLFNFKSSRF